MFVLTLILLVLVSAFFSISEIALTAARRTKLQVLSERGDRRATKVLLLKEEPGNFFTVVQIGVNSVRKALEVPMRRIAENAGKDGSVVVENVRQMQKSKKSKSIGFNVIKDEYLDLIKDGVIDPAKVTRGALENAASIAAMILTTEALVTDVPEKNPAPAAPPMPEY